MKPKAIICDLDGTLCNHKHRLHLVDPHLAGCHKEESKWGGHWWTKDSNTRWEPDYEAFYAEMDKDTVNEWCLDMCCSLIYFGYVSIFVTGRPEKYRKNTRDWLSKIQMGSKTIPHSPFKRYELFMRPDYLEEPLGNLFPGDTKGLVYKGPDYRPSHIVKREIFEREIKDKYEVLFVLEDDEECAEMYKDLGLTVLKVMQ